MIFLGKRAVLLLTIFLLILIGSAQAQSKNSFYLVFTGETNGFLEPCGCSDHPLGGLARRFTTIANLGGGKIPKLIIDSGDLVADYGEQDRIKLKFLLQAMHHIGYELIHLGERDHAWSGDFLQKELFRNGLVGLDSKTAPLLVTRKAGKHKILIGALSRAADYSSLLAMVKASANHGTFKVLMFHGSWQDARALALRNGPFNIIIAGHSQVDPPEPEQIGKTLVINYGTQGKYLGIAKIAVQSGGFTIAHEVRPIESTVAPAPVITQLLTGYDQELEDEQLVLKYANQRPLSPGRRYMGGDKCIECHDKQHTAWQASHHRNGYKTLVAVNKQHDPECIACHTVGYGDISGFSVAGKRPDLTGVGCENCHGPGYPHIKKPKKYPLVVDKKVCASNCHNMDHSPKFNFDHYWQKIKH